MNHPEQIVRALEFPKFPKSAMHSIKTRAGSAISWQATEIAVSSIPELRAVEPFCRV